ncbi:MAG: methionine synthase [Spirochaetales bacterium]|nr:hypothetical protein [Exilispira sp.]NMC67428.1 methionine synthase [Spirochaetales bacterium]
MKYKIYIPPKIYCFPEIKLFYSRCLIPFSSQSKDLNLIKKMNEIYYRSTFMLEPKIYYNSFYLDQLTEEIIPIQFKDIKKMTIFISTLGKIFDDFLQNLLNENRIFEAVVADAWGSESIEALNWHFDKYLKAKSLMRGTRRFSPGYGNVDITVNKFIVQNLFDIGEFSVFESGEIYPKKTTICFVGWYI